MILPLLTLLYSTAQSARRCEGWCESHGSPITDKCEWSTGACATCRFCDGYNLIENRHGRCLDAAGTGHQDVHMYDCSKSNRNQQWHFNANTGVIWNTLDNYYRVLSSDGDKEDDVEMWPRRERYVDEQRWAYNKATGQIKHTKHNKCLDASERNTNRGKVHLFDCDTKNKNQQWDIYNILEKRCECPWGYSHKDVKRSVKQGEQDRLEECCKPITQDCFENYVDMPGNDLKTVTNVANPAMCQYHCNEMDRCRFWSWNNADKKCWLKHSDRTKKSTRSEIASGAKNCDYYVLPKGRQCPREHQIEKKSRCEDAHDKLGLKKHLPWASTSVNIPPGCSTRQSGSHNLHFNVARTGKGRSDMTPVCYKDWQCHDFVTLEGQDQAWCDTNPSDVFYDYKNGKANKKALCGCDCCKKYRPPPQCDRTFIAYGSDVPRRLRGRFDVMVGLSTEGGRPVYRNGHDQYLYFSNRFDSKEEFRWVVGAGVMGDLDGQIIAPLLNDCSESGFDYYGNDIQNGKVKDVASYKACKILCQDKRECRYVSYRPEDKVCWLKHSDSGRRARTDMQSGPQKCGPRCEGWCHSHGAPEIERCAWDTLACAACSFCDEAAKSMRPSGVNKSQACPGGLNWEFETFKPVVVNGRNTVQRKMVQEVMQVMSYDGAGCHEVKITITGVESLATEDVDEQSVGNFEYDNCNGPEEIEPTYDLEHGISNTEESSLELSKGFDEMFEESTTTGFSVGIEVGSEVTAALEGPGYSVAATTHWTANMEGSLEKGKTRSNTITTSNTRVSSESKTTDTTWSNGASFTVPPHSRSTIIVHAKMGRADVQWKGQAVCLSHDGMELDRTPVSGTWEATFQKEISVSVQTTPCITNKAWKSLQRHECERVEGDYDYASLTEALTGCEKMGDHVCHGVMDMNCDHKGFWVLCKPGTVKRLDDENPLHHCTYKRRLPPTESPTYNPTEKPTLSPTEKPTESPTAKPTADAELKCTGWPIFVRTMSNEQKCLHGNTLEDGYVYAYNEGRGTSSAKCGSCWCCRKPRASDIVKSVKVMDVDIATNFELEFGLKPHGTVSGWSNILHISHGNENLGSGNRIPGVWFRSGSTRLHVCVQCGDNDNTCLDPEPLPMDQRSHVLVKIATGEFSVFIDGTMVASTSCVEPFVPPSGATAPLYVSDPWYPAANADISGLAYTPLIEELPTPDPTAAPTGSPTTAPTGTPTTKPTTDDGEKVLYAYWDKDMCGPDGNDARWEWCGKGEGKCQAQVETSECTSGVAELVSKQGDGTCCESVTIDGCSYAYFATYKCQPVKYVVGDAGTTCALPEDVIGSESECESALNTLALQFSPDDRWTGTYHKIPNGCSLNSNDHLHFNTLSGVGVGRNDLRPICKVHGKWCVRIVTGTDAHNEGTLDVYINDEKVATGNHNQGANVWDECYASEPKIEVQSPTTNGWAGTARMSSDAGATWHNVACASCSTDLSGPWGKLVADGDTGASDQGRQGCLGGNRCQLSLSEGYIDGGRATNDHGECLEDWYGPLEEAKTRCDANAECTVLHDYNGDGQNWRLCSSVTYQSDGPAATMKKLIEELPTPDPTAAPTGTPSAAPTGTPTTKPTTGTGSMCYCKNSADGEMIHERPQYASQTACTAETWCRWQEECASVGVTKTTDKGKYFHFEKDAWLTMTGEKEVSGTWKVKQTGSNIWEGEVIVWDNHNGVHGRRNAGASGGQWEQTDQITIDCSTGIEELPTPDPTAAPTATPSTAPTGSPTAAPTAETTTETPQDMLKKIKEYSSKVAKAEIPEKTELDSLKKMKSDAKKSQKSLKRFMKKAKKFESNYE